MIKGTATRLAKLKVRPSNRMAPSIQIDRNQTITLQCGQSMIKLSSDGTIDIEGITINIKAQMTINEEAQMQLNEKAMMIESKADAMHTTKAPMVDIKGDAMIKAQGGIVMIN